MFSYRYKGADNYIKIYIYLYQNMYVFMLFYACMYRYTLLLILKQWQKVPLRLLVRVSFIDVKDFSVTGGRMRQQLCHQNSAKGPKFFR